MSDFLDYEQLKYYDLNLKDVLKVWQKNYPYSKGDIVQYRGKYIECTKNGTSDKTVPLDIGNVSIGDTVADNDIISIRGFGKYIIEEQIGLTKKGRIKLSIKHFS